MSMSGTQRRYVSTLRIQLSAPASGGSSRQPTRPLHTITVPKRNGQETTGSVAEGNGLVGSLTTPLFLEPLQDCLVEEGNNFTLRAVITGSQPISVSWLHNGKVVQYGKSSFTGREAILVVQECLPEDAGAYTCVAENTSGKTSSSSAVCVKETVAGVRMNPIQSSPCPQFCFSPPRTPVLKNGGLSSAQNILEGNKSPRTGSPESLSSTHRKEVLVKRRSCSATAPPLKIVDPPEQVQVHAGECARLSCAFQGSFPIVSCWIHNKKEVLEDSRRRIENSSSGSSLVISEAWPEDSGLYTLIARDRRSSTYHILTLSVIERPQPPSSCPVPCILSPDSVVLSWSGPCYDGGSAVTHYLVEVQSVGPDQTGRWSELSAHCKNTSLRVSSGLQPQVQYRFRVRACNAVGVSEPSEESKPIKMDGAGELQDETVAEYANVTIDDKHKVTDHYTVQEKLGTGKFGQVFRLTHKMTGRVCAGKFYKGRRTKEREAAKKEIELMNFLHHPKLVQCLAAYDNKPEIVMVMEFIAGGELFERIVDDNFEHTEPTSIGYMRQIIQGIQFMHKQDIVHLDLKPENIVCVDRTGTRIKIIDFGLASKLDPSSPLKVLYGTPEFVAPEVISYEPVGPATDMWSVGVICYILLSGESPFQGESDSETLALVTAAQWEFDEESFEDITKQAKDFISSLLHKDTRRRMSCAEALAHSWMMAFESAQPNTAKNLSKEKMKKFLARQKWKKTGKAVLALKRMAMLTKAENCASPPSPAHETEDALKSLEKKMQSKPEFTKGPFDLSVFEDSTAQFFCQIAGYPDPEVVWSREGEPLEERDGSVKIEYEEDGTCILSLESVSLQHSGTYSCRATNIHGEALCSAKLNVVEQEEDVV